MIYLILLAVLAAVAFVINVAFRYEAVDRPSDVTPARWAWHTAIETAVMWACYVRSLPARVQDLRHGDTGGAPPAIAARQDRPPAAAPARPATPLPPAAPDPGRGHGPVLALNGIPADHAAAHERIATFEPENDDDWRDFLAGEARAALAHGEAWLAQAEGLANTVGLDPVVVEAVTLLAEAHADMAEMHAGIVQRLNQAYALVYEHLDGDGTLPYDGDWLGKAS